MPANGEQTSWNFQNTYPTLPELLYSKRQPVPVRHPETVVFNRPLAQQLGLSFLLDQEETIAAVFSGNQLPSGAEPIAQAYAGHQFGHFTILGDGRAILLGEQVTPDHKRYDIQLKGAGRTPYSRSGDGRATLSSMLREYLMSEAMHHLGIPTSRSLAVVKTGEPVYRETVRDGAVLTRVAASHIRVGTFEYVRTYGSTEELKAFTNYVIGRHYPELLETDQPVFEFLKAVIDRQLDLIAHWMRVGFIHGVMNTDNMSIAGETIDYGPCAFMNAYDPYTVFSSIDTNGRYAFGNQPRIAHWNLAVFAGALLPLLAEEEEKAVELARSVLDIIPQQYNQRWYEMLDKKLGILDPAPSDRALVIQLLELMEQHQADYTNLFVALRTDQTPDEAIFKDATFIDWRHQWKSRITKEGKQRAAFALMDTQNPYIIPRNHLVEEALEDAVNGDLSTFKDLSERLAKPYERQEEKLTLQTIPAGFDANYKTFCGT